MGEGAADTGPAHARGHSQISRRRRRASRMASPISQESGTRRRGYLRNLAKDLKEEVPFQPWAKAVYDERAAGLHWKDEPDANCLPQGVPKVLLAPAPWRVVQTPGIIFFVHEAFNLWWQAFTDGREFVPHDDVSPTWHGYSTAKWDGDTLVVDTRGFNGKIWLDQLGKPSTEALHVTTRFRRKDFGHMDIQTTIDDPKAYTRPVDGERGSAADAEYRADGVHLPRKRKGHEEEMTRDEIVALVGRCQSALDRHDAVAIAAEYAEDCVMESPTAGGTITGRDAIEGVYRAWFAGFPDLVVTPEELLIDGDQLAHRMTLTGTDSGGFLGLPATAKPFRIAVVWLCRLGAGQIIHSRHVYDYSGMLIQIGVLKAKPA